MNKPRLQKKKQVETPEILSSAFNYFNIMGTIRMTYLTWDLVTDKIDALSL